MTLAFPIDNDPTVEPRRLVSLSEARAITFTGVRCREAGSYQAFKDGRPLGTFATAAEAGTALDAIEWSPEFLALIAELKRAAVNGNYELGNCHWTTASEQRRNQRSRAAP